MNTENALLFAQVAKGCDILRLLFKVIKGNPKVSSGAYQIKESITEGKNDEYRHPTLAAHGSHIDIGYHLIPKDSPNTVLRVGLFLQAFRPPNVFAWIDEKHRGKFTANAGGKNYGPPEDEDCPIGDGFWLPLSNREELFNSEASDTERLNVLEGFFDEIIDKLG
jgi:hypothetical protein